MVMIVSIMVSYVAIVYFYQTLAVFQVESIWSNSLVVLQYDYLLLTTVENQEFYANAPARDLLLWVIVQY